MSVEKVRENKVRRKAARQGLTLAKSKRRDPDALDFGGYMLIDAKTNITVAGAVPRPYGLSLEDAERWLTKG